MVGDGCTYRLHIARPIRIDYKLNLQGWYVELTVEGVGQNGGASTWELGWGDALC